MGARSTREQVTRRVALTLQCPRRRLVQNCRDRDDREDCPDYHGRRRAHQLRWTLEAMARAVRG
jgi:hypothetical protein